MLLGMDTDEKVRENRLRRVTQRRGLHLVRNPRRDPRAADYGSYKIVDGNWGIVADFGWAHLSRPTGATRLDDVEAWLNREGPPQC